eukprot:TRINITY_DN22730_c0_g1_i1.p1 TRINITY_DN22730_c0_g1~~TRINITY_DN22730_c0_g1_i1.p1  ORF type:complete len:394 (-),score=139.54 TRINITY_DN22730_c0_g1_i1:14-1081(-)
MATEILTQFVTESSKNVLRGMRKKLKSAMDSAGVTKNFQGKITGAVTAAQLMECIRVLRECNDDEVEVDHTLLDMTWVLCQAIHQSTEQLWDELGGIEKVLTLVSTTDQSTMVTELINVLKTPVKGEQTISFDDFMRFCMMVYSMQGGDTLSMQDQLMLSDVLLQEMLSKSRVANRISSQVGETGEAQDILEELPSEVSVDETIENQFQMEVQDMFAKLRSVSIIREHLNNSKLSKMLDDSGYRGGLLSRLCELMWSNDDDAADLSDLYVVGGESQIQNLISSGLSLWNGTESSSSASGNHPGKNQITVLFVVGGVTPPEIAEIQKCAKGMYKGTVLIASTNIATGEQVMRGVMS